MKAIKVSQINGYIKSLFDKDFILSEVKLTGELSGFTPKSSGHLYFKMVDKNSQISCIMWNGNYDYGIIKKLKDGDLIEAVGRVALYTKGGNYSFQINEIILNDEGEILKKLNELKEKLKKEGLFDESHKKQIPAFPKNIALITADNSAALADMLKIIQGRNNFVNIYIFPVKVQGENSAAELRRAVKKVNEDYNFIDTIIIGRGGGSTSDLMAFNDEALAREIFASSIPIISAVGHEIDFSISDFAADKRAETPTEAAHLAVPDIYEIMQEMDEILLKLKNKLKSKLEYNEAVLNKFSNKVLEKNINYKINLLEGNLNLFNYKMQKEKFLNMLSEEFYRLNNLKENTKNILMNKIDNYAKKCELILKGIDSKSPLEILERGYAYIENSDGKNLKRISDFNIEGKVIAKLFDGEVELERKI